MSTENKQHSYFHIAIIVLLVINIVVSVLNMKSAENIEIMKVGGEENYAKLITIMQSEEYKNQYAQNLELMLQQIQGGGQELLPPTDEVETIPSSGEDITVSNDGQAPVDNQLSQGDE